MNKKIIFFVWILLYIYLCGCDNASQNNLLNQEITTLKKSMEDLKKENDKHQESENQMFAELEEEKETIRELKETLELDLKQEIIRLRNETLILTEGNHKREEELRLSKKKIEAIGSISKQELDEKLQKLEARLYKIESYFFEKEMTELNESVKQLRFEMMSFFRENNIHFIREQIKQEMEAYKNAPQEKHLDSFDPNKQWKIAEVLGQEGLTLYNEGLALRDQANNDFSSPKWKDYFLKWQEAKIKFDNACNQGEKVVFLRLCVLLNMSEKDSESWVARYKKTSTELDDFGDFMTKNKMIPESKQKEILEEWKKKTGEYQYKMAVWQEKIYDINKSMRLDEDHE